MTSVNEPPTGDAGSRSIGNQKPKPEPLPIEGPQGVDPDRWARALVADRSWSMWTRFTIADVLSEYRRPMCWLATSALGGGGLWALLPHLSG